MKVHLHGNCQVSVLAAMLKEVCPDWTISSFEVHADAIITQNELYQDAIRTSDIILSQPIHEGYRGREDLALGWIREAARPGADIVVIPAMHFTGHHLGYCGLSSLGDHCLDAVAAHLVAAGVSPTQALEMMLSPNLYTEAFVQSEIALSMAEMVRRETDDNIDVKFSLFEDHFARTRQAFHIVNHPARPPYAYVLNAVLERLDIRCGRLAFEGHDYQSIPHIPMSPSVAFHCQNLFSTETDRIEDHVRFHGQPPVTQREYFTKVLEQLSDHTAEEIRSSVRGIWQAAAFLKRLSAADPALPGIEIWSD